MLTIFIPTNRFRKYNRWYRNGHSRCSAPLLPFFFSGE